MKLPTSLTQVTPFYKSLAFALFIAMPFIGFVLGIKYKESLSAYQQKYQQPVPSFSTTPTPAIGHTASVPETYTTRDLHFKLPPGWWLDMTTNIYFGDNWVLINPSPTKEIESIFVLKSTSGKYEPTFDYKNLLKDTKVENFSVSGIKGMLITGTAIPPTGPDITCPECYLGRYKAGDKVAVALIKKDNNYYLLEGNIDKYEDEYRQIISSFSFFPD